MSKIRWFVCLSLSLLCLGGALIWRSQRAQAKENAQPKAATVKLPLWFEANRGQAPNGVRYLAHAAGMSLALSSDGATLQLAAAQPASLQLKWHGGNRQTKLRGLEATAARSHYLLGSDQRRWLRNVPHFGRVQYDAVYPGIDVIFYGQGQRLEYDFVVAPGADARRIELRFAGAQSLNLNAAGDLVLQLAAGEVRQKAPVAYQDTPQGRRFVEARYVLARGGRVKFALGDYDRALPLCIDPVIEYSGVLAGSVDALAVDAQGNLYLAGETSVVNFPGPSPIQGALGGQTDAFVAKLNPEGSAVLFATFLGGTSFDQANALATDAAGNAYVTGVTNSTDYPLTLNAAQRQLGGRNDVFVSKLAADGSELLYSTYWGGNGFETANGIAVDAAGNAAIVGWTISRNLPNAPLSGAAFYQSANRGVSWTASDNGLLTSGVTAVTVDPTNGNRLYAATVDGLFKSENKGASWNRASLTLAIQDVAIDPKNPQVIYCAGYGGEYFKSTDGGANFTAQFLLVSSDIFRMNQIVIDPVNTATLYGATNAGVIKSLNGGATWARTSLGLPQPPLSINDLVIAPSQPQTLYAATATDVLYKTTDGGQNWTRLTGTLPTSAGGIPSRFQKLAVDPRTPNTLYGIPSIFLVPLYKSTDGGLSWQAASNGLSYQAGGQTQAVRLNDIVIDAGTSTTLYASGAGGGLFRSTDGGATWNLARQGLNNLIVSALAADGAGNLFAGTAIGGDAFISRLNANGSAVAAQRLLGGFEGDEASGVKFDPQGNLVVAGLTNSYNFPTRNALQANNRGLLDFQPTTDAFVARLNPATLEVLTSTYYGGEANDQVRALAVDAGGNVYLTGPTFSTNLPTTPNSFQPANGTNNSGNAFLAKFNPALTALSFATYFGGNAEDLPTGIAVDGSGYVYVTGQTTSSDFPLVNAIPRTLAQSFRTSNRDVFLSKFNANGAALVFSTLIGGVGEETSGWVVVDGKRNLYLSGTTGSFDFPSVNPPFARPTQQVGYLGFLMKLGPQADLAVTGAAQHSPVMANNPYRYTLTVTNLGPEEALDVTLNERIPANLTNASVSASVGTCSGAPNVQCRLGELAVGASATVTIAGTAPTTGTLEQSATVTSATADAVSANNRVTATTTVGASPSVAGRVLLGDGTPLAGATINLSGSATATRQSNAAGAYQFTELVRGGSYNVAAQRAGYVLRPATQSLPNVQSDQTVNFTATFCTFNVTANQTGFPMNGGNGTLTVTANDALCVWQARSNAPWLTLNAAGGTGNGTLTLTVAATTAPRSGTVTIGGRTLTIAQEAGSCATPNLRIASSAALPVSAQTLLSGDFNNDQITDVAVFGSTEAAVMMGNGTGGFVAAQPINLGLAANENITSSAVGDLNGDGRSDIVIGVLGPQTRALAGLLANAGGGFATPQRTNVGNEFTPGALALAAVDSDNRADLLVNNTYAGAVTVLLGKGDGTFTVTGNRVGQGVNFPFTTGDFDQDNRLDLLFTNFNQVSFYAGDGNGGFQQLASFNSNFNNPTSLVAADFNRDGKLDFALQGTGVVGNASTTRTLIFLNQGAGQFGTPLSIQTTPAAGRMVARDFNNDGWTDLVAVNAGSGISLLLNSANGFNRPPVHYSAANVYNHLVVTDVDRDSRPDVLLLAPPYSNSGVGSQLVTLKGTAVDFVAGRSASVLGNVTALVNGDFNSDGHPDVAYLLDEQNQFSSTPLQSIVVRLTEGAQFGAELRTESAGQLALSATDFNGDGKLDLIVRDSYTLRFLAGDGAGKFDFVNRLVVGEAPAAGGNNVITPLPLALADFNRDGRDDLVSFGADKQPVLYLSQSASFQNPRAVAPGQNFSEFRPGDFNGDGNPDLLALPPANSAALNIGNALLYLGDGQGNFAAPRRTSLPFAPSALLVDDLNGDGRTDLAGTTGLFPSALILLFANADGSFAQSENLALPSSAVALASGDLNNDGRKDLALALGFGLGDGFATSLQVSLQRANGTFAAPVLVGPLESASFLSIGAYTSDGLNDVFAFSRTSVNGGTGWLTLYANQCQTTRSLALASAASYGNAAFAPEAIVAAFGTGLATSTVTARTNPLPRELAGTRIRVTDASGMERFAQIFFVSPTQINFLLPAGLLSGNAQVTITGGDNIVSTGVIQIAPVAPGVFTANADGRGVPSAVALRVRVDGVLLYEPLLQLDRQTNRFVPLPLDFGLATDQLFLILYGTGVRGRSALSNVSARVGGLNAPVTYAGPQNDLAGLDQINVQLPRELRGRGEVDVQLTVDGQTANVVRIALR